MCDTSTRHVLRGANTLVKDTGRGNSPADARVNRTLRRSGFKKVLWKLFFLFFVHTHQISICFPASGQAIVTGVVPSSPRFLPSIFIAHRGHQSHCSPIFYRVLLTHAPTLSASQFMHEKKSPWIYTCSMHSAGLELAKLAYTRL